MKKLLAYVLVVAMIASVCVFSVDAAGSTGKLSGKVLYFDEDNAYGYVKDVGWRPNDTTIELDAAFQCAGLHEGDETCQIIALNVKTEAGDDSSIQIYPDHIDFMGQNVEYNWGDSSLANQKHLKYEFLEGNAKLYIDGEEVATGKGDLAPFYSDLNGEGKHTTLCFWSYTDRLYIDNVKGTRTTSGGTYFEADFEDGNKGIFGDSAGTVIDLPEIPVEPSYLFEGKCLYLSEDAAYNYFNVSHEFANNDVGIEFDVVFLSDNPDESAEPSEYRIAASEGDMRIARDHIGCKSLGYATLDCKLGWANQYHMKVEFTKAGPRAWVDGELVYTNDKVVTVNNTGFLWFFSQYGSNAVDNVKVYVPSTGEVLMSDDFNSGSRDNLGADTLGEIIDVPDIEEEPTLPMQGNCWYWDNGNAYGYWNTPKNLDANDISVEFDAVILEEGAENPANFGIHDRLVLIKEDKIVINGVETPFEWGPQTWKNQRHVKFEFVGTTCTVYVDGVAAATGTATFPVTGSTGFMIFSYDEGLAVDNIVISKPSDGTVYASGNFDDKTEVDMTSGGGKQIAVPKIDLNDPTVTSLAKGQHTVSFAEGKLLSTEWVASYDLYLLPDENGAASFRYVLADEYFDEYYVDVATDVKAGTGSVAVKDMSGSTLQTADFSWGEADYNNSHSFSIDIKADSTVVSIDGTTVLTLTGAYNGMRGYQLFETLAGRALMDNLALTSADLTVESNFDADLTDGTKLPGSRITIMPCNGPVHYYSVYYAVVSEPTCTVDGEKRADCLLCHNSYKSETIPALDHLWVDGFAEYDSKVDATETEDGSLTYTCKREGCSQTATTTIPATGKYTGTYVAFSDMSDLNVIHHIIGMGSGDAKVDVSNGYYQLLPGDEQNYREMFEDVDPDDGFTGSFDFRLDSLYGDGDKTLYFWFGGNDNVSAQIGFDFANNKAFVKDNQGININKSVDYTMPVGEWHNVSFKFKQDWATEFVSVQLLVDNVPVITLDSNEEGQEMLIYTLGYTDEGDGTPAGSYVIPRSFGALFSLDNLVIGSYDFAWTNLPELLGDVNDDGKVSLKDLLRVRKYLAGIIDETGLNMANADVDYGRDGLTARDVVALKKIVSAV